MERRGGGEWSEERNGKKKRPYGEGFENVDILYILVERMLTGRSTPLVLIGWFLDHFHRHHDTRLTAAAPALKLV
jgi:hypothetical protein